MRRHLKFSFSGGNYTISELDQVLFTINTNDMRFDSLAFYNGIYKSKSCSATIEPENNLDSKGKYIFNWVSDIVLYITKNCGEPNVEESEKREDELFLKRIKLFDLPACAGNGNFVDTESGEPFETENQNADFAVRISGNSMEPNIPDQSIVLVRKSEGENCVNDDIYIIEYKGDVMCKRFRKLSRGGNFVSDNMSGNYIKINSHQISECRIQGKVIEIIPTTCLATAPNCIATECQAENEKDI